MKRFLKFVPFLLMFVLTFGMQVYLDTENTYKPFLDPFGRETQAGTMTPNRPPQVLGDDRYAWLHGPNLVISTVKAESKQVTEENRPLPDQDIYSRTLFQLVGDDLFWIGKSSVLKHAVWQNGKWSAPQELGKEAESIYAAQVGGKRLLIAGVDQQLKVWNVAANGMQELRSFPAKRLVYVSGATGADNILHVGAVDQTSESNYELSYLTVDAAKGQVSDLTMTKELALSSGNMIYDSSFGIDKKNGYYLLTYKSNRRDNRQLYAFTFPLNKPAAVQEVKFEGADNQNIDFEFSYGAYPLQGQGEDLPFVFSASYVKNPRSSGFEVFRSTLQGGKWKSDSTERLSNLHRVTLNPVITKHGEDTTVLFTQMSSYEDYQVWYNSDNRNYVSSTNQLTKDDYLQSAMSVPKYIGIAIISLFIAMAWPVLSYCYLIFYVLKNEDALYDRPNRHLLIAVAIYLVSQYWVFF
ncbi:MAG: hypothetical protein WCC10_12140, partial [Tumebacillaceae bacterium]